MIPFLIAALAGSAVRLNHPRTYLASIAGLPLQKGEQLESFSIDTWGVTFTAVCSIPPGWTIRAGGQGSPDGVLAGEASQGVTWLDRRRSAHELNRFVLVTLYAPVQKHEIREPNGAGVIPATFAGEAIVAEAEGEVEERKVTLSYANVRLTPARRCPTRR